MDILDPQRDTCPTTPRKGPTVQGILRYSTPLHFCLMELEKGGSSKGPQPSFPLGMFCSLEVVDPKEVPLARLTDLRFGEVFSRGQLFRGGTGGLRRGLRAPRPRGGAVERHPVTGGSPPQGGAASKLGFPIRFLKTRFVSTILEVRKPKSGCWDGGRAGIGVVVFGKLCRPVSRVALRDGCP